MTASSPRAEIPIVFVEECGSTMDVARDMFEQGSGSATALPFAVRALTQTKGRGTGARVWASVTGNLHLTVVLPSPQSSGGSGSGNRLMSLFPCVLGIALFNALNRVVMQQVPRSDAVPFDVSKSPLVLKWPNDVLVRATGAKVCGNLVESLYCRATKQTALSVGIGVNVATPVIISDGGRAGATLADVVQQLVLAAKQEQQGASAAAAQSKASQQQQQHQNERDDAPEPERKLTLQDSAAPEADAAAAAPSLDAGDVARVVCEELLAALAAAEKQPDAVVAEFGRRLDMNTAVFRRLDDGRQRDPDPLKPVRLTEHGALIAKSTTTGQEIELAAEYLF